MFMILHQVFYSVTQKTQIIGKLNLPTFPDYASLTVFVIAIAIAITIIIIMTYYY